MKPITLEQALNALQEFDLPSAPNGCMPHGNGHINSTFMVLCPMKDRTEKRYILQAINTDVFHNPDQLIDNISRVTAFLRERTGDPRRVLALIPTKDGRGYYSDPDGCCWRMYQFIEDAVCLERAETPEDMVQCGLAFGCFQRDLHDFPADSLWETLPDFHNTPKRYRDFLKAVEEDVVGRAAAVQPEIEFIQARVPFMDTLYAAHRRGDLPLRVTHNDTKPNNVMLDEKTRTALCVIDLDTVMPGFSVNDFGDAVRFGANTAAEDEPDTSRVALDLTLFDAYARGFVKGCGGLLQESEIRLLPEGAKMMTLECGMRFLEDYLKGDVYFKVHRPLHNLIRCRTQLALVADMEKKWEEMHRLIERYI